MAFLLRFLLAGIFMVIYRLTYGFDVRCPQSSHRIVRAKGLCNKTALSKYSCLYDENLEQHVESCTTEPDHVRPGQKYVITGRRRNVNCSTARYQPFIFWSNVSSQCAFKRSKCNEHGQVLYNNGTLVKDRLCRCDYSNGFAFLTEPKHRCYCLLSEEDCTCYKMQCSGKLTSDYKCAQNNSRTYPQCPPIIKLNEDEPLNEKIITIDEKDSTGSSRILEIVVLIGGIVVVAFLGFLTLVCCFEKDPESPADLSAVIEAGGIRLSWIPPTFPGQKCIKEYRVLCDGITVDSVVKRGTSSCIIQDVLPSTEYKLKVILCTINDIEKASDDFTYTTPDPDSPDDLSAVIEADGIRLSWSSPTFPGKHSIKGYKVLCDGTEINSDFKQKTTSCFIPDVLPTTAYKLNVVLCTNNYIEKRSNNFLYTTPDAGIPDDLSAEIETGGIRLAWIMPKFPGRKSIKSYKILCDGKEVSTIEARGMPSCFISDVLPSKEYKFKVILCTINDIEKSSTEFSYTTPDPAIPDDLCAVLEIHGIRLSWVHPNFPGIKSIKNYKILCDGKEFISDLTRGTSTYLIPDVLPSHTYNLKVVMCTNNDIETSSKDYLYRSPDSDCPGNINASNIDDSINLSWVPPKFPGKECIKSYTILIDGKEYLTVLKQRTAFRIYHLKPLTTYKLNVAIFTTNGFIKKSEKEYEHTTSALKYDEKPLKNPAMIGRSPLDNGSSDFESKSQKYAEFERSKQQQHSENQNQISRTDKNKTSSSASAEIPIDLEKMEIEDWKIKDLMFVPTKASSLLFDLVQNKNCVFVTGLPGVGKSYLIRHIALTLEQEHQFQIIPCKKVSKVKKFRNNVSQVFVLDDICGKFTLEHTKLKELSAYRDDINRLCNTGKTKLLISCRKQLFQELKFKPVEFIAANHIDLSSLDLKLTTEENLAIAVKYLNWRDVEKIKPMLSDCLDVFPLQCYIFSSTTNADAANIFKDPSELYTKELNEQDKTTLCILFLFVIFDGCLDISVFEEKDKHICEMFKAVCRVFGIQDLSMIENKLPSFVNVYIRQIDKTYEFIHNKMFDVLCSFFGEKNQNEIIIYADSKVIRDRTQLKCLELDARENSIMIEDSNKGAYFSRLTSDILKGNVDDVFHNNQMGNQNFRTMFMAYISKDMVSFKNVVASKSCRRDNESSELETPLEFVCSLGYIDLVNFFYQRDGSKLKTTERLACLIAACERGNLNVVEFLLKDDSEKKELLKEDMNPLDMACINGHEEIVEYLIQKGFPVDMKNVEGTTPLMVASHVGQTAIVKLLTYKGANVNSVNIYHMSPLKFACFGAHLKVVEFLLSEGAEPDHSYEDGRTPLVIAYEENDKSILDLMLSNSDINATDKSGKTPLIKACISEHFETVKTIIELGADIDKSDKDKWTALKRTSKNGNIDIARILLENKALVNAKDIGGWTPLKTAALNGHFDLVNHLLAFNAKVDEPDDDSWTPFMSACQTGHTNIADLLLSHGANMYHKAKGGMTALLTACHNGQLDVVSLLLNKQAIVNSYDNDSWTPLRFACMGNHVKTAELLISNGAEVDYYDKEKCTPLKAACVKGNCELVELLVQSGANVNFPDAKRWVPLKIASLLGHEEIIEKLLICGAEVDFPDEDGWTPLMSACQGGNTNAVNKLLTKANSNHMSNLGTTPLAVACKNGNDEIVKILIDGEANINLDDNEGRTPLFVACEMDKLSTVELLLSLNADVHLGNSRGLKPIHIAAIKGTLKIVTSLIKAGSKVNEGCNRGWSPLKWACIKNNALIVEFLLSTKAEVNKQDDEGWTPLKFAANSGYIESLRLLLKYNADPNISDNKGWTPLMAASTKCKTVVEELVVHGAKINQCQTKYGSALHIACFNENKDIIEYLLKHEADLNLTNENGETPLQLSCKKGNIDIISVLVNAGAEINVADKCGRTPIAVAVDNENQAVVDMLIKHNVDVNRPDEKGRTPLLLACDKGLETIVDLLLTVDSDINTLSKNGWTPLRKAQNGHYKIIEHKLILNGAKTQENSLQEACRFGYIELIESFHYPEAEINEIGEDGLSPLMNACVGNHFDIIEYFIKNNWVNENQTDEWIDFFKNHPSLFTNVCGKGHFLTVNLLCQKGVNIDKSDDQGTYPIICACEGGHDKVVEFLFTRGADLNVHDSQGVSPLSMACSHEHVTIVDFLLKKDCVVNEVDNEGKSPLHKSCELNNIFLAELLVDKGADVNKTSVLSPSPITIAVFKSCFDIVELLLKKGSKLQPRSPELNYLEKFTDNEGSTTLEIACMFGHEHLVRLLANVSNVNSSDKNGITPLIHACEKNQASVAKHLIGLGADVSKKAKNGFTAMFATCKAGNIEALNILLEINADINIQHEDGETPIITAYKNNKLDVCKLLLDKNVDTNLASSEGLTILNHACQQFDCQMIDLLLQYTKLEEDLKQWNDIEEYFEKNGKSLLTEACTFGYINIYRMLENKDRQRLNNCDAYKMTMCACRGGHLDILKELLELKVDIDNNDSEGFTPLSVACEAGHKEIVDLLLERKASMNQVSPKRVIPLHVACKRLHIHIIESLLLKGADVDISDEEGNTPLLLSCKTENINLAEILIANKADCNRRDNNGRSPISIACECSCLGLVYLLLKQNVEVNIQDQHGWTPITEACYADNIDIMQVLFDHGADVNLFDSEGFSLIHFACIRENIRILEFLIDNNADVNKSDAIHIQDTPLMLACQLGNRAIFNLLFEKSNIYQANKDGKNVLHIACKHGQLHFVEQLINKNMFVNIQDEKGVTPLKEVCSSAGGPNHAIKTLLRDLSKLKQKIAKIIPDVKPGIRQIFMDKVFTEKVVPIKEYTKIAEYLIKNEADVNISDSDGWTPLMSACQGGRKNIVELLLESNALLNIKGISEWSPLTLACSRGHRDIVELLLEKNIDVNYPDNDGWTPLKAACRWGRDHIVQLLLSRNAGINQVDNDGWTPLMSACQGGHTDIVKLLLDNNSDINWVGNFGYSACDVALKEKKYDVVSLLRDSGGEITEENYMIGTDSDSEGEDDYSDEIKTMAEKFAGLIDESDEIPSECLTS